MKSPVLIALSALLLFSWGSVGCTTTTEAMIEYHRTGGFAGRDDHLRIRENGEAILVRGAERVAFTLDDRTLRRLQTLFAEAQFTRLGRVSRPPRAGADRLQDVVTYRGHTVRVVDEAVPPELRPILEALDRIVEAPPGP